MLLLLAGVAGGGWVWATRERPARGSGGVRRRAAAGTQAAVLNASGYVTARRRATVSSKITGKVVEVNVEEGMAVREGQVLARLDDANARAALALAEAQAEAARRNDRGKRSAAGRGARHARPAHAAASRSGVVTQSEVDQAQADVDSIAARIAAAREQVRVAERQVDVQQTDLDNTIIRAPFSGVAVSKDAQPGEMVSPVSAGGGFTRTGICTIVDMRSLEIEVDVNESYINRVAAGQQRDRRAQRVSRLADPGARHHDGADGRSAEGDGAGAHRRSRQLDPRILPDMGVKVTFLRDGPVDADDGDRRARRRSCRRPPCGPTAGRPATCSSCATTARRAPRRADAAARTATGSRSLAGLRAGRAGRRSPPPAECSSGWRAVGRDRSGPMSGSSA